MSIIRILISISGYICCLYALGYYYVMASNWTAYLVIPVIVLVTIELIRFLLEELEEVRTIKQKCGLKDFEDSLLHDQDPRERE